MITMFDPRYVYRPRSDEERQKLREAQQRRLGIPSGFCRIHGQLFPIEYRQPIKKLVYDMKRRLDQAEHKLEMTRAKLSQLEQRLEQADTKLEKARSKITELETTIRVMLGMQK